jgi:hypothetical protein
MRLGKCMVRLRLCLFEPRAVMGSRFRDAWAPFGHIQGIVTMFQWGHWYFIAGGATLIGTILSGFIGTPWGVFCTLISAPYILVCLTYITLLRDRSRRDIELNAFRRAGAKLLNERLLSTSVLPDWVARVTTWTDQTAAEIQRLTEQPKRSGSRFLF